MTQTVVEILRGVLECAERSDGTFYSGLTADGLVREAEELG